MENPSFSHNESQENLRARPRRQPNTPDADDLTGIFEIDGNSYDVMLNKEKISWTPMSYSGKSKAVKQKKASRNSWWKKARGAKEEPCPESAQQESDGDTLLLCHLFGIKIKRQRRATQGEGEGVCQGMALHTFKFNKKGSNPNKLKQHVLVMLNPSEEICVRWARRIQSELDAFDERPKKAKVFLQPFAGKKFSRSVYNKEVQPLFETAGIKADMTEVSHNEQIKQEMIHLDLSAYDSIVCVGGDGTVSKVMSSLLEKYQRDMDLEMKTTSTPVKAAIPLGVIPVGTTNQVLYSLQGTDDVFTATAHILLGNTHPIDVCSTYHKDKFLRWAFNCHYGFFGSVLPFVSRYALLGDRKKMDAAFAKSLTSSKFRPYECEIRYISAAEPESNNPLNKRLCRRGCNVCQVDDVLDQPGATFTDEVQELDPLNDSNNSSTLIDMSNENPWKSLKGQYMNVSVLTNPAMSYLAPLGMSQYSHLADGTIDLIMVKNTERKQFIRFLRRHGNAKNQLDFPFVQAVRCREVHFHVRFHETWHHKDYGFNEINYNMEQKQQKLTSEVGQVTDGVEVIDDLIEDFSDDEDEESKDGDHEEEEEDEEEEVTVIKTPSSGSARSCRSSDTLDDQRKPKIQPGTNTVMFVSDNYRPSLLEQERVRRMKHVQKKDEKKRKRATSKMKSLWNVDNEPQAELDLHFRVHQGLLHMFGQGVAMPYEPDEVKMGCLSVF